MANRLVVHQDWDWAIIRSTTPTCYVVRLQIKMGEENKIGSVHEAAPEVVVTPKVRPGAATSVCVLIKV